MTWHLASGLHIPISLSLSFYIHPVCTKEIKSFFSVYCGLLASCSSSFGSTNQKAYLCVAEFPPTETAFFCAVVHIGSEKLIQGFQTGQYFFSKEERWLLFHIGFSLSATPQTTAPIFHIFFNHTAFFGQAFCYLVVLLYPSFGRFLLHVCMSCCGAHYIFVTE